MQTGWNAKKLYTVSLVTTCMGRLFHLKETIIKNIEANKTYPKLEVVLLDYNSPDGLEDWVRMHLKRYIDQGVLSYYKTTQPKFFHMSHAKNVAHLLATGDIVSNVDADNLTGHGYAEHLNDMFVDNRRAYCRCSRNGDNGTGGRVAMMRDDFIRMGGYEERMMGWGYEDADLVLRARRHHLQPTFTHSIWCKAIQHDDASRERFHTPPERDRALRKSESMRVNYELFETNRRIRETVANRERPWGAAKLLKNFRLPMEVSSALLVRPSKLGPVVALPHPAEAPAVADDFLPDDPKLPVIEAAPEPLKPKTVGFFSVSPHLRMTTVPLEATEPNKTGKNEKGKMKR